VVRLFSTTDVACSRSGSARIRLGGFFFRDFEFGIGDGLLTVADPQHCGVYRGWTLCLTRSEHDDLEDVVRAPKEEREHNPLDDVRSASGHPDQW
jgi:hypothetical protein